MAGSQQPSKSRQKESKGREKYGSGAGSSGPGNVRVRSNTPENRSGEMNPSAPTGATEGPSTNLASDQADGGTGRGASRGEPAREETKANAGTIKKPWGKTPGSVKPRDSLQGTGYREFDSILLFPVHCSVT